MFDDIKGMQFMNKCLWMTRLDETKDIGSLTIKIMLTQFLMSGGHSFLSMTLLSHENP